MRSRVFHSGEPAADVEFCLVFPRESLSVPVMRRVLGDTLSQPRHRRELRRRSAAGGDRGLHERAAARRTRPALRTGRPRQQQAMPARGTRHRPRLRPGRVRRRSRRSGIRHSVRPVAKAAPAPDLACLDSRRRRRRTRCAAGSSGRGGWPANGPSPSCPSRAAAWRSCGPASTTSSMRSKPGQGTVVSLQKRIEWRSDAPLARRPASQLRDAG